MKISIRFALVLLIVSISVAAWARIGAARPSDASAARAGYPIANFFRQGLKLPFRAATLVHAHGGH